MATSSATTATRTVVTVAVPPVRLRVALRVLGRGRLFARVFSARIRRRSTRPWAWESPQGAIHRIFPVPPSQLLVDRATVARRLPQVPSVACTCSRCCAGDPFDVCVLVAIKTGRTVSGHVYFSRTLQAVHVRTPVVRVRQKTHICTSDHLPGSQHLQRRRDRSSEHSHRRRRAIHGR